jgi:CubicO group peptidase (beta-lactamase class C family)
MSAKFRLFRAHSILCIGASGSLLAFAACASAPTGDAQRADEAVATQSSAELVSGFGYYCSAVQPSTGAWQFLYGSTDSNPCKSLQGWKIARAGLYSTTAETTVVAQCDGAGWTGGQWGTATLDIVKGWASSTAPLPTSCVFTVTPGWVVPPPPTNNPSTPCANGALPAQDFGSTPDGVHHVVGCAGNVSFGQRASLCGPGWAPAPVSAWQQIVSNGSVPTNDYWVDEALNFHYYGPVNPNTNTQGPGKSGQCAATNAPVSNPFSAFPNDVESCGSEGAMHVCAPSGGTCTWTECGSDTYYNQHIGGCSPSAGTLCMQDLRAHGCADGSIGQDFSYVDASGVHTLVGCAGSKPFAQRTELCEKGWTLASAADWQGVPAGLASPTHNYWTSDLLGYSGSSQACTVSTDPSYNACAGAQSMAVCTTSGAEASGCVWHGCGLGAGTGTFGGCASTAGALCKPPPYKGPYGGDLKTYTLDESAFMNAMVQDLSSKMGHGGFQAVLYNPKGNRVGNVVAQGVASRSPSVVPMTSNQRIDMASVSKTITSIALVAAIEDAQSRGWGITFDSPVYPYLPSSWNVPAAYKTLTFRQVAEHRAGMAGENCGGPVFVSPFYPAGTLAAENRYLSVKGAVEQGPGGRGIGEYCYSNQGYSLLRILIAYLVEGPAFFQPYELSADQPYPSTLLIDALTAESYRNYIKTRIFDPIGVSGVDEFDTNATPTEYFVDPGSGTRGPFVELDAEMIAGAGSWTLTVDEMAKLLVNLRLGKIISLAGYNEMTAFEGQGDYAFGLGGYPADGGGRILTHNGAGGGASAEWAMSPNGYVAVWAANTSFTSTQLGLGSYFKSALSHSP